MEAIEKCQSEVQSLEKQMAIHFDYIDKITTAEVKNIDDIAKQLNQVSTQLTDRIAYLEKNQYVNEGRKGISSPLLMMTASFIGGVVVFIIQKLISLF